MSVINAQDRFQPEKETRTWIHCCSEHPDLNGKKGVQKVRCHIKTKCPFCKQHPPE